jgi:hypothetical protein
MESACHPENFAFPPPQFIFSKMNVTIAASERRHTRDASRSFWEDEFRASASGGSAVCLVRVAALALPGGSGAGKAASARRIDAEVNATLDLGVMAIPSEQPD